MDGPRAGDLAEACRALSPTASAPTSKVSRRETAETPPEARILPMDLQKTEIVNVRFPSTSVLLHTVSTFHFP